MAKALMVTLGTQTFSLGVSEVERGDLYGTRKRVPTDSQGRNCTRAALTGDGSLLVASGMSGQGYFNGEGQYVPRAQLVGIDAQGTVVESQPSTLGVPQALEGPVDPATVLDLELVGVYLLEPEQAASPLVDRLKAGDIYACDFNYAASLEVERAYLLANDQGLFAIVGKPVQVGWVEEGARFAPPVEAAEASDDLDFEML
ncbi:MAG: hypothetical protein RI884_2693 [Pseudomonadota bacterium]|jgi:hypothetical protein